MCLLSLALKNNLVFILFVVFLSMSKRGEFVEDGPNIYAFIGLSLDGNHTCFDQAFLETLMSFEGWLRLWRLSRISGEWSNMIGNEMDSSPVGVYTMAKTSSVENFIHG